MRDRIEIGQAMADVAREINSPRSLEATLDTIVRVARESLPTVDQVGISIAHKGGELETAAATDELVWELDRLQYKLGEGPCVHAVHAAELVVVENARHDQRWPRFLSEAVKLGLRAQMGLCLYVDGRTIGGLNLYSFTEDTFAPETQHIAELFATQAALALGHARRAEELNTAIGTRADIGKAVGLVMARFDLDDDRAFDYLVRLSSHANIKIRDVAAEIVAQHNDKHRSRSSGESG